MYVREVMTTQVHTVHVDASFEEVVTFLVSHNVSGVPVIDDTNRLRGVISEKDLFSHLFPPLEDFYKDPRYWMSHSTLEAEASHVTRKRAGELITTKVITIGPDDRVLKACALLMIHGIRRLPVLDQGVLIGIVTTNDLYRKFLSTMFEPA